MTPLVESTLTFPVPSCEDPDDLLFWDGFDDHCRNVRRIFADAVAGGLCALSLEEDSGKGHRTCHLVSPSLEGPGWRASVLIDDIPVGHTEVRDIDGIDRELGCRLFGGCTARAMFAVPA